MSNSQIQVNSAIALIQSGNFESADQQLQVINEKNRGNAFTWFLQGVAQASYAKNKSAINSLKTCLKLQPNYPEALYNLGVILEREGELDEAKVLYQKSLKLKPDYISAIFSLGSIYQQQLNFEKAIETYKSALQKDPKNINSLNNLGLCFLAIQDYLQAYNTFYEALKSAPNDVELLVNLSSTLYKLKKFEQALTHLIKAKNIDPNKIEIYDNLGMNLQSLKRYEEAKQHFSFALDINPESSKTLGNVGNLLKELGDYFLAIQYYDKALSQNPNITDFMINKAICLLYVGHYKQAMECYEKILIIDPENSKALYNLGTYYLSSGNLVKGWSYYKHRPCSRNEKAESPDKLLAVQLIQKNVLVTGEQGIGDEMFFLRYLESLSSVTSNIDFLATAKMAGLIKQVKLINDLYTEMPDISKYDHIVSVGDLPLLLQGSSNIFPPSIAIEAEKQLTLEMHSYLKKLGPPPYIGITWRAGQEIDGLLFKEIDIESLFDTLKNIDGTILILQRHPKKEELEICENYQSKHNIHDLSHLNDDLPRMLALLNCVDEYIGVSNTNVHLLAALNKTAHVLVEQLPEWRWMFQGDESPWFPGTMVYRQNFNGKWDSAIEQLRNNLEAKYLEKV